MVTRKNDIAHPHHGGFFFCPTIRMHRQSIVVTRRRCTTNYKLEIGYFVSTSIVHAAMSAVLVIPRGITSCGERRGKQFQNGGAVLEIEIAMGEGLTTGERGTELDRGDSVRRWTEG